MNQDKKNDGGNKGGSSQASGDKGGKQIAIPSISLPKGGGALKNIDEKFQVNAENGSASFSLPLPFSKSRGEFIPAMSLNYNSGAGNGVWGLGWHLDSASISRRTDKLLPDYQDAIEGDVFIFSGAEDLVPVLEQDSAGNWVTTQFVAPTGETIKTYRPRIESGFSRIEQIRPANATSFYWKITNRHNIATIYGRSASARIADPADPDHIYSWLPELSYDDKGNCFELGYVAEDLKQVAPVVHEGNRLNGNAPFANCYLKRVRYGNQAPYLPDPGTPYDPALPTDPGYFFEMVLDYGDHDPLVPTPAIQKDWPCRIDPFSNYKPGFEVRTYRLCQRILFFHYFKELNDGVNAAPCLIRSLDLSYRIFGNAAVTPAAAHNAEVDYLVAIRQTGYIKNGTGGYDSKSMPPLNFSFQELHWNTELQTIDTDDMANAPVGIGGNYQWVDLWGEGISGILTEQGQGWYYKRNLGEGKFDNAQQVIPKPSFTGLSDGSLQLQDLDADGRKFAVATSGPVRGYFELADDNTWEPFLPLTGYPNIDMHDPNARLIDLNGDGIPDLIVAEEDVFTWYPNQGTLGYEAAQRRLKPYDEEVGPALVFQDPVQSIFLADMSGDGLTDIVRIRNGEVCYWPNLGYGKFGAKVNMSDAPWFDLHDMFNPAYLHLADINGTGAADLIYLGQDQVKIWLNRSGNGWTDVVVVDSFPPSETPNVFSVIDLLGSGTGCLVWSSPLPANAGFPLRYIDLLGGVKPYIMQGYDNSFGKTVQWTYKSSTSYYLADELAGRPWLTKLPFAVQCVSQTVTNDSVMQTSLTSLYIYHHGYYDHPEREFRGFGMVEQTDSDSFENYLLQGGAVIEEELFQMPVLTKTWFHLGDYVGEENVLAAFESEYFQNPSFPEYHLPLPLLPAGLSVQATREAHRAFKGNVIRQEVYGLDNTAAAAIPYSVAERNLQVHLLQEVGTNRYASFLVTECESISYHYERAAADPRITHSLNTVIDELGNVLETASVAYPRQVVDPAAPADVSAAQQKLAITYTVNAFTNDCIDPSFYRLRVACEGQAFELTGVNPLSQWFGITELAAAFGGAAAIGFEAVPDGSPQKRWIGHQRQLFLDNNTSDALPLGQQQSLGLPMEAYRKAFTASLLVNLYNSVASAADLNTWLTAGKYLLSDTYKAASLFPGTDPDGEWWLPSGKVGFPANPSACFYLPDRYFDPLGNKTTVSYYGNYYLLIAQTIDAVQNTTTVQAFDWRTLSPQLVQDINNNLTAVAFDILGFVAGAATMGKGTEADDLTGFVTELTDVQGSGFFSDPVSTAAGLLQHATSRFVYDFSVLPARIGSIVRETHYQQTLIDGQPSALQLAIEYSDGEGRTVLKKIQAEPGPALQLSGGKVITVDTTPNLRWIGNGRTVLNNKGKPIKQYEPYFSVTSAFEDDSQLVDIGVTPLLYYDPPGRLIRAEFPNGTFSKTEWDGWQQVSYDPNDTVTDSDWYTERTTGSLASDVLENQAAQKAAVHYDTPSLIWLDNLGRSCHLTEHNRFMDHATNVLVDEYYDSRTLLDIQGHELSVIDPRGNTVLTYAYDMAGNKVSIQSMDTGPRWTLNDCMGKPLFAWDGKNQQFATLYDAIHRPVQSTVSKGGGTPQLYEKIVYGEGQPNDQALNLRGEIWQHYDQAGLSTQLSIDFKGNVLGSSIQLTKDYQQLIDWNTGPVLQAEVFSSQTTFDALNRPVSQIEPNSNPAFANKIVPGYNESGLLTTVNAYLRGAATPTAFVRNIEYDEKGQRTHIQYGNNSVTNYTYDPLSFRITRLVTTRNAGADILQDLNYTYDPFGNITHIEDDAQDTIFFANRKIEPANDYTYDAKYRLTEATGREQIAGQQTPDAYDAFRINFTQPGDGNTLQTYRQQFTYDAAGNMLLMQNVGSWNRQFTYAPGNNQLLTAPSSNPVATPFTYTYDSNGNMLAMPHIPGMDWNYKDQLSHLTLSASTENDNAQQCWYVYNSAGQRIRKVVVKGNITEERLYLGSIEIFRRTTGVTPVLERETLHIMDSERRIAMVDTPVQQPAGAGETQLIRYQYANHIGTACLELDNSAAIISYEEYYPFGSTSYQASDAGTEVPAKRYRYTGKERDGESGLYYHGSRYYAPWLARWTAADPTGTSDGLNLYAYVKNNPVLFNDPSGNSSDDGDEKPGPVLDVLSHLGISTDKGGDSDSGGGGGLFQGIANFFSSIGHAIASGFRSAAHWVAGAATSAWNWIKGAATTAWNWIQGAATSAWNWVKGAAHTAWEWTKGAAHTAWNWIKGAASSAWNWIKGAANTAWNWIKGAASTAWNWIKGAASTVWEGVKTVARFTWNWILAPLIRTVSNTIVGAAIGFLIGGIPGAITGGAIGLVTGAIHGWAMASAHSYDWSSPGGWGAFLLDNTWSAANSFVGSLWATINIFRTPIDNSSRDSNALVFTNGLIPGYATTFGNVIAGTNPLHHELSHTLQARIFGPLFYPLMAAHYVINTVLPYWLLYHNKRWPTKPITNFGQYFSRGVYPHTWAEEWGYSIEGSPQ